MMMQWLSNPEESWWLNSDIEDLDGDVLGGNPLLSFQRYDVQLEPDWLAENCGGVFTKSQVRKFQKMDDPAILTDLYDLAKVAAEKQVVIPDAHSPV